MRYGNDSPLCPAAHNGESLPYLNEQLIRAERFDRKSQLSSMLTKCLA